MIVSEAREIGSFWAELGVKTPNHCWKRSRRNWTHDLVSTCVDLRAVAPLVLTAAPAPAAGAACGVGKVEDVGSVGAVGGGDGSGNIVNMADEEDRRGVEVFDESPTPSPVDGLGDLGSWPAATPGRTGGGVPRGSGTWLGVAAAEGD